MIQNYLFKNLVIFTLISVFSVASVMAQPSLMISSTEAKPGGTFTLELTLDSNGKEISAISTDIIFDASILLIADAEIGPAANAAGKMIFQNNVSDGKYRVGILSISNNDAIEDGVVAYLSGSVGNAAPEQTVKIFQAASASDPKGLDITISSPDADLTIGGKLPEEIETYVVLKEGFETYTVADKSYAQVFGSTHRNIVNIKSGGRVQFMNFIGSNELNIEESSAHFTVYRSGATVYLNSSAGTLIEIAATRTGQKLRFTNGSSDLVISAGNIMLGNQIISREKTGVETPKDSSDTSSSVF